MSDEREPTDEEETQEILNDARTMDALRKAQHERDAGVLLEDSVVRPGKGPMTDTRDTLEKVERQLRERAIYAMPDELLALADRLRALRERQQKAWERVGHVESMLRNAKSAAGEREASLVSNQMACSFADLLRSAREEASDG